MSNLNQFELASPPGDAISAVTFAPGSSSKLLVSSWDRHVHLYDTQSQSSGQLLNRFEFQAPVLDICFGKDENEAFAVGLDWDVRRLDLQSGEQTTLSSHDSPSSQVVFSSDHGLLISSSWDSTLHLHHPSQYPNLTAATLPLPAKPFALSISPTKLVVAMSGRLVHIYDLAALATLSSQSNQAPPNTIQAEPFQRRESSLKFLTRAVACMPNDLGYATSSIEGRVAVEWFDASEESQARKYAFKCHRQTTLAEDGGDTVDVVYPVHALAFHPVYGTFASGGGDGVVALWDAEAKRRIRQYQRFTASVACLAFSNDGMKMAVGVSPGFESGHEENGIANEPVKIFVRDMAEGEAKGRASK